jgi:lipopolysaccharide export system permease protein
MHAIAAPHTQTLICHSPFVMPTLRRLLYRDLVISIAYVCLGFLALFAFFDLVDELSSLGQSVSAAAGSYQFVQALLFVLLQVPGHIYELLPIAVLIGGVLVMARFAQSSEFTILRTSGLGPGLALKTLLKLGVWFVILTFVMGDYLAPAANRFAQLMKAQYQNAQGAISVGHTGAWLKERQDFHQYAVNVGALDGESRMNGVRIYEFDAKGAIVSTTDAQSATFDDDAWLLQSAKRIEYPAGKADKLTVIDSPQLRWPTQLNAQMVQVALLKPERMSTYSLFRYIQHLDSNGQSAQLFEIEFWKKLFYTLSCLVMLMLALPFAYLHFRSGGIAGYVFGGVMTGISFFLLNNVFGYLGQISQWTPMLAASAPSLIYLLISLSAFGWVVYKK